MMEKLGQLVCNQFGEIRISLREIRGEPHVELQVFPRPTPGNGNGLPGGQAIALPAALLPAFLRVMGQAQDLLLKRGTIYVPSLADITTMERGEAIAVGQGPLSHQPSSRRHPRLPLDLAVECRVIDAASFWPGKPVTGKINDLSMGGAQVCLPKRLPRFQEVEVLMMSEGRLLRARAEVVGADLEREGRDSGPYRHHLRWVAMEADAKAVLSKVVGEALVGGENHGAPLEPGADDRTQAVRPQPVDREVPDFVEDEQPGGGVERALPFEPPLAHRLGQRTDHHRDRGEENPVALLAGREAEPQREVDLAHPWGPEEEDVLPRLHEPAGGEGLDLLLLQRRLAAEVEGRECPPEGEVGQAGPHGDELLGLRGDAPGQDDLKWSLQRRFPRYPIRLPVLHKPKGPPKAGVGWTRDLSEGGACVELAERLPPQTVYSLRLQTERGPIEVEAQVAWAGEPEVGGGIPHGVAFTQIAPDQREALRDLLRARGKVEECGVRLPLALPVMCRPPGHFGPPLHGRTGDVSRWGLSLCLLQALPPGTPLELTLHTPRGPLTVAGTVVWVDPPEGRSPGALIAHGVRFTSLDWPTSLSLGLVLIESV